MSIKAYVDELTMINLEIKSNNLRNKELRKRTKELEQSISSYLQSKEQPGIKYNGQAIIVENKERRLPKTKKEREEDVLLYLESIGISDPQTVYEKLEEAKKGYTVEETKIKFKNLAKYK